MILARLLLALSFLAIVIGAIAQDPVNETKPVQPPAPPSFHD